MKTICAWCNQEISDIPEQDNVLGYAITHGICNECKAYFFSDRQLTLDKFLNHIAAPVLLVDSDMNILSANNEALVLLGKKLPIIQGFKSGDVLGCTYSGHPGGCGQTLHCQSCTIRISVTTTYTTGENLKRIPTYLNRENNHEVYKIKYYISTEKIDNFVLLCIDEIN